ncbi:MAG: class I SAM-dependent methyltransferase [Salibacteraceae bacterium]
MLSTWHFIKQNQVDSATKTAQSKGLSNRTKFTVEDFHNTSFQDNSFDVVWFVESFCHSDELDKLVREVKRILKPNGRVIIADVFLEQNKSQQTQTMLMKKWVTSWAVNEVSSRDTVTSLLNKNNFSKITPYDYTQSIRRSSLILYFYANLAITYGKLRHFLGKTYGNDITIKNTYGAKYQYLALRKQLWNYSIITAHNTID